MTLSLKLVPVKKISSKSSLANFTENEVLQLARNALKTGGFINPPVLIRTSLESYEVIAGDFAYYAAVKAREIDPLNGEMIGAFIVEPENATSLQEQIELLRSKPTNPVSESLEPQQPFLASKVLTRDDHEAFKREMITNLEAVKSELLATKREMITNLEASESKILAAIRESLAKPVPPPARPQPPKETVLDLEAERKFIEAVFNTMEKPALKDLFALAGIANATASKIIDSILKERPFVNSKDLLKRGQGIGEKTLAKLRSAYSQTN